MRNISIPVITYHHVNCHQGDKVTVTPEYFEEQMKYLSSRGYKTIFIPELISCLEQKEALPEKAVALTFDDGYVDNRVYAYPILKKYGMKATIFVITSLTEEIHTSSQPVIPRHAEVRPRDMMGKDLSDAYLSWAEMREMEAGGLIDIQSHTHRHKNLAEEGVDIEEELTISRQLIEKNLSKDCRFIAWPWGSCNQEVTALARKLGYQGGVITDRGANTFNFDPMRIKRLDTEKGNVGWLSRKLFIYSHPTIAKIYLALRT
ncbi:MAG: polysaccharide deacetylase family protein [Nitrospirae bacterium]|nr:polysaccharide deacetylase family protein [Nitrospirota bacterium]